MTVPGAAGDAGLLVGVIRDLMAEVRPAEPAAVVLLDIRFAGDLGLDSLIVVELRSRVDEAFGVVLPDRVLRPRPWAVAGYSTAVRSGAGPAVPATGGPAPVPLKAAADGLSAGAETLPAALAWHARTHPGRTHIRLLQTTEEESSSQDITYGELAAGVGGGRPRSGDTPIAAPHG